MADKTENEPQEKLQEKAEQVVEVLSDVSEGNAEIPNMSLAMLLLEMVEGLSDDATLAVLEAFKNIPKAIKRGVVSIYDDLKYLGLGKEPDDIKIGLKALKSSCGEGYKDLYKMVEKDTLHYLNKIQNRMFKDSLAEED